LGVSAGDNITWNNRTNQTVTLKVLTVMTADGSTPQVSFPFDSIPAGSVSNPIFNADFVDANKNPLRSVPLWIGYYWVRPAIVAKPRAARKGSSVGAVRASTPAPPPAQPDHWILVTD